MNHYLIPSWPAPPHIRAYSTTRAVGNLAAHVGDDAEIVRQNREKLIRDLHLPNMPVWLNQVHGNEVVSLDQTFTQTPQADAAYSTTSNRICTVMTADCLPLLITNTTGTEIAAIHAGWRGLLTGVIDQTLAKLKTSAENLLVWLGPAIGPNAFEVGPEVREAYINRHIEYQNAFRSHHSRYLANLYQLATINLNRLGVQNIYGGNFCTYEQKDLFYSYRREGQTGRMATLIYIPKADEF